MGAGAGAIRTEINFADDLSFDLEQQALTAFAGYTLASGWSLRLSAGVITGGALESDDVPGRFALQPGGLVGFAGSRQWTPGDGRWFVTGTALARHMGQHGGGVIAGITANAAKESYPYTGGFGVACAAVESFLKLLGNENGPSGVRVVWVRSAGSPDAWGVREAFKLRANEQGITLEEFEKQAAKDVPLRHLPALAEVADAAVMMMSDLGRATTSTFANVTCGAQVD